LTLSDSKAGSPPPSSPAPQLGRYKILRVIARSNDVVYEAIDPGINRRVAVKELALSTNLSGQQRRERIERFYREAKAAGNLSHPNIVTVYEVGHDGDRHYIAMEYLEGPSLRDILRMRNSLSIRESLNVALQLTDALGYAHGQGVVHRDVKPDNIHLIVPNDVVKLTDFGIARILADPAITSTGQVFGTPSYMSPEQIMSKEVDHRTDIFSLGVVLYEMIVGKKPFTGDSVITITYHIMNSQPVIPNTLPAGVYNIISRALTKDPAQRYQNMASMAADLQSEIAFSDSPYHRTIPPGSFTAQELSDEQTAMVSRGDLAAPTMQPRQSSTAPPAGYAPSTGIADAVAGGSVTPATSVTPMAIPHPQPIPQDAGNNTGALIWSILGVMALILIVVFVVAKAYHANQVSAQNEQALHYYDLANTEMTSGDRTSAIRDYEQAFQQASPGSPVSVNAKLAISQLTTSALSPSTAAPDTSLDAATPVAPTPASPSSQLTLPSPTPPASSGTGKQAADADLQAANTYMAQNDQTDAVSQLEAAASADPTGDSGKTAANQLSQILLQQADTAMQNGQKKTALADWQLILKYASATPAAAEATQKIGENGYQEPYQSVPVSPGSGNQPSDQTPVPSSP
jgi:serine/threonine protein kinase